MAAVESAQLVILLWGGSGVALLVAGAVVLLRGSRRGAGLGLAVFLLGLGGQLAWFLPLLLLGANAIPPGLFDAISSVWLLLGAAAGVGLLLFLVGFPRPLGAEDRGTFLLAAAAVVALIGANWAQGRGASLSLDGAARSVLGAAAEGPLLLAVLALPLRFHAARDLAWDRAGIAWLAAMLVPYIALAFSTSFFTLSSFGAWGAGFPELAFLGAGAVLWLRATTSGPPEATRTARNLALLTLAAVAAGFLAGRLDLPPAGTFSPRLASMGAVSAARVAMAAMAIDGVLRQRLLEGLDEPPARQVEAPPPA